VRPDAEGSCRRILAVDPKGGPCGDFGSSHAARPPRRLPRWLELVIAVTALVTSISSIAIAVHHGKIMEKLVQANSVPYMQGGFSNVTPEGHHVLSLDLLNRGVGPAHEQVCASRWAIVTSDQWTNS
jgi:hypothetical protein